MDDRDVSDSHVFSGVPPEIHDAPGNRKVYAESSAVLAWLLEEEEESPRIRQLSRMAERLGLPLRPEQERRSSTRSGHGDATRHAAESHGRKRLSQQKRSASRGPIDMCVALARCTTL